MKLRNKETGEIFTVDYIVNDKGEKALYLDTAPDGYEFIGVPLIKDKKIRKAVRAWAEANDFAKIEVTHCRKHYLRIMNETTDILIEFSCFMDDLLDERVYTIAELCGEEEE